MVSTSSVAPVLLRTRFSLPLSFGRPFFVVALLHVVVALGLERLYTLGVKPTQTEVEEVTGLLVKGAYRAENNVGLQSYTFTVPILGPLIVFQFFENF